MALKCGIVGLPNAGKSSLLAAITNANPKIANYKFTTLNPNLGVASYDNKEITLADIPGLIEGAHDGKGLGDRFLGHVERCSILIHLIDCLSDDPHQDWKTIRNEIKSYSGDLADKNEIIALSKTDTISEDERDKKIKTLEDMTGKEIFALSSVTNKGLEEILNKVLNVIKKNEEVEKEEKWSP